MDVCFVQEFMGVCIATRNLSAVGSNPCQLFCKFPLFLGSRVLFSVLPHSLCPNSSKSPGTRSTPKVSHFYQDDLSVFQVFPPPWQAHRNLFTRGENSQVQSLCLTSLVAPLHPCESLGKQGSKTLFPPFPVPLEEDHLRHMFGIFK